MQIILEINNKKSFDPIKVVSQITCLINLVYHIKIVNSQGRFARNIFINLQKALNPVDPDILCEKLEFMGLTFTGWFESYLKRRTQAVIPKESNLETGTVTCGVSEGSILGPLLFLRYINEMQKSLMCMLLLYDEDSAVKF